MLRKQITFTTSEKFYLLWIFALNCLGVACLWATAVGVMVIFE